MKISLNNYVFLLNKWRFYLSNQINSYQLTNLNLEVEMMDKYFDYRKHKTDFKTEVVAGVSTFLTMAYIMFLNPVILADGGFDFGGVFTATALAAALACFIAAFYAKTWPIGLAPGMGINAFIAYGVCLGMEYTPAEALGAVLVAGVVFLIISYLQLNIEYHRFYKQT